MNKQAEATRIPRGPAPSNQGTWEQVGETSQPNWYLDPLVARQKRDTHRTLILRWTQGLRFQRVLKTDLFEEAFGEDSFYGSLFPELRVLHGMDLANATARKAGARVPRLAALSTDARRTGLRSASFGLVISNSTFDHFPTRQDFLAALREVVRVIEPGGRLIITMDNPHNPLYWGLRAAGRLGLLPFPLGYTTSARQLRADLAELGMKTLDDDWLIHNPRSFSTLLFLLLRAALGTNADGSIRALLAAFALLDKLPTRRFTACFYAVSAARPAAPR